MAHHRVIIVDDCNSIGFSPLLLMFSIQIIDIFNPSAVFEVQRARFPHTRSSVKRI
jgi:hypothetical protein